MKKIVMQYKYWMGSPYQYKWDYIASINSNPIFSKLHDETIEECYEDHSFEFYVSFDDQKYYSIGFFALKDLNPE